MNEKVPGKRTQAQLLTRKLKRAKPSEVSLKAFVRSVASAEHPLRENAKKWAERKKLKLK